MTFLWVEAGERSFKPGFWPPREEDLQVRKLYVMLTAKFLSTYCFYWI